MRASGPLRDPGRYFWALFGEPDRASPWGYRYEGHHLSLNVTVTPDGVATTPLFIGSQPRVVPEGLDVGPPAGTAVLGEEERLARALYAALDDDQRRRATLDYEADRGLMIGQVARIDSTRPVGVARRDLTTAGAAGCTARWPGGSVERRAGGRAPRRYRRRSRRPALRPRRGRHAAPQFLHANCRAVAARRDRQHPGRRSSARRLAPDERRLRRRSARRASDGGSPGAAGTALSAGFSHSGRCQTSGHSFRRARLQDDNSARAGNRHGHR